MNTRRDTPLLNIARNLGIQRGELNVLNALEFPLDIAPPFLNLPGLRGLWIAGGVGSGGDMFDRSGTGMTLTYTGNPTQNVDNGYTPYWAYDGTGDYHTRADEAALDILGTEAFVAAGGRGITLGGWYWQNNITGDQALAGKWTVAGNLRQYKLYSNAGVITLGISSNGTAEALYAGSTVAAGAWYFAVGRWTPSVTGDIFVNGVKVSNVSAVAAMTNLTSAFRIADRGDALTLLTGRMALCFLCGAALSDNLIQSLWYRTRPIFGV